MTYEEASDGIKTWLGCMRKANKGNDFANEFIDCAEFMTKSVVREAIEKQIPKKPRKFDENYKSFSFDCPECGGYLVSEIDGELCAGQRYKYCHRCGQAIDWSEEE